MSRSYFPSWRLVYPKNDLDVVAPDERLPLGQNTAMGAQHVVAMFGSTILAPLLMGFDPNVAILMSGIGTLIFFVFVAGRVPSYLGSSFAFIGGVIAVTGYVGAGPNANIGVALGAIIACGLAYTVIGLIVWFISARTSMGVDWINRLMPPVVTGAIVAVIGLNLAPIAAQGAMGAGTFDALMALMTVLCVGGVAMYSRGILQRLLILAGLVIACLIYALFTNVLGFGPPLDASKVMQAPWFGMPSFSSPVFAPEAMSVIVPVAIILVAENLGHIKAVAAMTGRNLDKYLGPAFMGDGVATML